MASIKARTGKRGRTYRVRYYDPDGRERSRSFKRKAEADDFATSVRHEIRSGTYVDPKAGEQTVKAFLEKWRKQQAHHRPKTAAMTKTRFERMVYPFVGDIPIGSVRPSTVREWQAELVAVPYAPRTIRGARGMLAGAFADAVRDRVLRESPFVGVKAPEVVRERVVPLTVAQVRAGIDAAPARYRALLVLVAGTGLRAGEAWGLTRDRLDLDRAVVTVDRQLVERRGGEPVFGPPKTSASDRTVPLPRNVVEALEKHLAEWPAAPDELVFRTARGGPLTRSVWGKAWRAPAEAMGLPRGKGLHQLRHFYASLLIAAGRSPREVQERLGHQSMDETIKTYIHLWHAADEGTRDAIDAAFDAPENAP